MLQVSTDAPFFSQAPPRLRSSILTASHPNTDFSKNQNCLAISNPMAQVYRSSHFSGQDWHSDDFGFRTPVTQKAFYLQQTDMCYLYRRTRRTCRTCSEITRVFLSEVYAFASYVMIFVRGACFHSRVSLIEALPVCAPTGWLALFNQIRAQNQWAFICFYAATRTPFPC